MPTTPYEQFRTTKFFGSLDGVRSLCILAVIFHHVPGLEHLPRIFHLGYLGVDGFFVLSGLLIETLLLRERSQRGTFSLPNFYIRRTLRICPIYFLLLAGLFVMLRATQPGSDAYRDFVRELPYFVTYTCNWIEIHAVNMGVLWSLATEEQFYLVWPFVEKYAGRLGSLVALGTLLGANQLINFGALNGWEARTYDLGQVPSILQTTFTPILLGVALGRMMHNPPTFAVLSRVIGHRASPLVLLAVLGGIALVTPDDIQGWFRLVIQLTMALLIASVMIREDQGLAPVLRLALLRRLGVVSYGAYLYHMTVIHLARKVLERVHLENPWVLLAVVVVGTYAVSEVSFRLIESPLLSLKERLTRGRGGVAAQT